MKADIHRLYRDVEKLSGIKPPRNYLNPESLEKANVYIQQEFFKAGFLPQIQKWEVDNNPYSNIIASYNSDKKDRLIIGAHYDVCGEQPGADDNASGVAGLLETARLISATKPKIPYRIDFVAYSLEEPPFFGTENMGSYIHAKYLSENKISVLGMICFEMIGYFCNKPKSQKFPYPELNNSFPDKGNFIIILAWNKQKEFSEKVYELMGKNSKIDVHLINFPSKSGLAVLSDHSNYWKFGYNAVMINDTAFLRNPNYHEETDTIETLNFHKMCYVVNSSFNSIIKLK